MTMERTTGYVADCLKNDTEIILSIDEKSIWILVMDISKLGKINLVFRLINQMFITYWTSFPHLVIQSQQQDLAMQAKCNASRENDLQE